MNCKEAFLEAIQKSSLGLKIEEQNQVIQMDLKDDCMVLADSGKLITIFSNLIKNAFQAIQKKYEDNFLKGKIIIHLDQSTDVDYLVFSVTDNGCGMNSSQLKKAFDPFYTTKAKGTGLGLSICQKWCGDFGGEMKIKSIEGEGSQVLIKLPRVYS